MTVLTMRLLGAPEVLCNGESIRFRSRKEFALLIYLAVEERWHARNALIALLWPDSDHHHGRVVLRSTLSTLRKRLSTMGDIILTAGDRLAFNRALPLEFDLQRLEAVLQPETEIAKKLAFLGTMGGEFLTGFSLDDAPGFDEWATFQREQWQQRVERGWDQLSQTLLEAGEQVTAVKAAAQWLSRSPLNEAAYRH